MNTKELLKTSYLCRGLDEDELDSVAQIAIIRHLRKKEILFIEGDPASGFYILLSGRVRLYKSSPDGKEYTLHQISPGQMFAEVAVFHGNKFPANCIALEDSVVALFPKLEFVELLEESPQIALKIIGALSSFLRDFNHQIEQLSLKEVPARLAGYILQESNKSGGDTVTLEISKSELANHLGTISETLSRNLRKFIDAGLIEVNHKEIKITDRDKLIDIYEGGKI